MKSENSESNSIKNKIVDKNFPSKKGRKSI